MDQEAFSIDGGRGIEISGVFCRPGEETKSGVLLCHGFLSNAESSTNLSLTERLNATGIATVRFDFWGHGKSKGAFADLTLTRCIDQLERVLSWFKTKGIRKVAMMGSSYGGLVTLMAAENHPELRAMALKCPVSDYPAIWREQLGEAGMSHWEQAGVTSLMNEDGSRARLNYAFFQDLTRYNAYNSAALIRLPVLIVHGDADAYVPLAQSRRLKDTLLGEKHLEVISGADHGFSRTEDFEKMVGRVSEWLHEKLR